MNYPKEVFRSYDIRGFLDQITQELAEDIGAALVSNVNLKKVVIGRDMRQTSPQLLESAIRGVNKMGAKVVNIGMTNTSVFNYATTTIDGVDAGIMITASHNPANYNGIKVVLRDGSSVSGNKLYEMISSDFEESDVLGDSKKIDIVDEYIDACVNKVDLPDLSNVNIVVDYGNGMGAVSMRPLLKRLGVNFKELYSEPNADFPNHEANPADEETLEDLKAEVVESSADFGIAFDGDMDRMRLIDEKGRAVSSDALLALLARDMLKDQSGKGVVVTVNMGWAVREEIERLGGVVLESSVGRTNVPIVGRANNGVLGGEVSGHFVFENFHFLESIDYAVVRILSLYARENVQLSTITDELMDRYSNSGEVNREIENKDEALKKVLEKYQNEASEVNLQDGVKCTFDKKWWFILRKSNTEPVVRLTVEAKTEEEMIEKRNEILTLIGAKL